MIKVPNFKDPEVTKFLIQLVQQLDQTDIDNLSSVTANASLLLHSPSAKTFSVTVSDTGTLVVTKVQG
jgi:hypothetical protein